MRKAASACVSWMCPAPQFGGVGFGAVRAQQIGAVGLVFPPAFFEVAGDGQGARGSARVALDCRLDDFCRGGIFAEPASDPAFDCAGFLVGFCAQRGVDLLQFGAEFFRLAREHGAFFFGARSAAAEDVLFFALAVGVRDEPRFESALDALPAFLVEQCAFKITQLCLGRSDEVAGVALAQKAMFLSLTIPRSITHTRFACPYFRSMSATICSTVVTSLRLPANTSNESGSPSGEHTRPMHTCLQSLR